MCERVRLADVVDHERVSVSKLTQFVLLGRGRREDGVLPLRYRCFGARVCGALRRQRRVLQVHYVSVKLSQTSHGRIREVLFH